MGVDKKYADESLNFYDSEINRLKWVINDITRRGISAIHEFDIKRGFDVPKALLKLNEDLVYFQEKFKARQLELTAPVSQEIKK